MRIVTTVSAALLLGTALTAPVVAQDTMPVVVQPIQPTQPSIQVRPVATPVVPVAVAETPTEDTPPVEPESLNQQKFFIDTTVAEVAVDDTMTVVRMAMLPDSPCNSDAYVYGRDRPKWLYQTGRLLQALREGAALRVSFNCVDGLQSINALQFLSPPNPNGGRGLRGPSETVVLTQDTAPLRATVAIDNIPLPTPASNTTAFPSPAAAPPEQRVRRVPLP